MNTTRLTIILISVAIILLVAVPQLRQSLWGTYLIFQLERPPAAIWLNKPHGEKLSRQYSRDAKVWLGFAEVRAHAVSSPEWYGLSVESWSPDQAFERAISLWPDSPAPYLRYAVYLLARSPKIERKEEYGARRQKEVKYTASEMSNLRRAERLLEHAQGLAPQNSACGYLLAYTYLAQHKDEQAFVALGAAVSKPHWSMYQV